MHKQKALFLDRDGVINKDLGYVYKKEDFIFNNIFPTLLEFQKLGYLLIVITNQSGIGRGFFTKKEYFSLENHIQQIFLEKKIVITKTYFCPHHLKAKKPFNIDCPWRKPNPGMILQAQSDFNLDLDKSIFVGDKLSDMLAATHAKVAYKFFLSKDIAIDFKLCKALNIKQIKNIKDIKAD